MQIFKKILIIIILALSLVSCDILSQSGEKNISTETSLSTTESTPLYSIKFDHDKFSFNGDREALIHENDTLTITKGGSYELSGHLENGNIVIDIGDDSIHLIFAEGFSLGDRADTAIYLKSSGSTTLEIKEENTHIYLNQLSKTD